jgi:hypothetical protein
VNGLSHDLEFLYTVGFAKNIATDFKPLSITLAPLPWVRVEASIPFPEDSIVRFQSTFLQGKDFDAVAICRDQLPERLPSNRPEQFGSCALQTTLKVAIEALPNPDDLTALDDILTFKAELRDKQWDFRRFLKNLASKKQSEAEIRDDIEWTINEYRKAMEIHHIEPWPMYNILTQRYVNIWS